MLFPVIPKPSRYLVENKQLSFPRFLISPFPHFPVSSFPVSSFPVPAFITTPIFVVPQVTIVTVHVPDIIANVNTNINENANEKCRFWLP